mmetsp:Transcript_41903/g.115526  ORF Transcript_41903/g.115526 Transcript_41903/m.115526 type:complete len:206 (+) Transcript_41903:439-1056(+)
MVTLLVPERTRPIPRHRVNRLPENRGLRLRICWRWVRVNWRRWRPRRLRIRWPRLRVRWRMLHIRRRCLTVNWRRWRRRRLRIRLGVNLGDRPRRRASGRYRRRRNEAHEQLQGKELLEVGVGTDRRVEQVAKLSLSVVAEADRKRLPERGLSWHGGEVHLSGALEIERKLLEICIPSLDSPTLRPACHEDRIIGDTASDKAGHD